MAEARAARRQATPATEVIGDVERVVQPRLREPYHFEFTHIPIYFVLLVGAVVSITPFFYMVSTSLMTLGETINRVILPAKPQFVNYEIAWTESNFALYFRNSVIITALVIAGVLITCTLAGYAFARIRFPGREVLFTILLATLMIPGTVTFIPNLLLIRGQVIPWGSWMNSLPALTVPFMATAFIIFLFRQFFVGIPGELFDAARIDGAGPVRTLLGIMLPMVKNGVVVVIIINFVAAWGEYLLAKTLNTNQSAQTLPVVLATATGGMGAWVWPRLAAVYIMAITPGLIIFAFAQRWYIKGLQEGALKA